jgi:hypothetical protein
VGGKRLGRKYFGDSLDDGLDRSSVVWSCRLFIIALDASMLTSMPWAPAGSSVLVLAACREHTGLGKRNLDPVLDPRSPHHSHVVGSRVGKRVQELEVAIVGDHFTSLGLVMPRHRFHIRKVRQVIVATSDCKSELAVFRQDRRRMNVRNARID